MLLGVNIDHIATIRQVRGTTYPDPLDAVAICLKSGGDSITAHLREDRRHIQDRDMARLCTIPDLHVNMEMAATDEMVGICCDLKPIACCLVPEKREELTTEGGLDVIGGEAYLRPAIARLNAAGVRVSLFIDADKAQINKAIELGAAVIELHTGHYADVTGQARQDELKRLQDAATFAAGMGLIVHAGHGLTLENTPDIAAIPELKELNIGHAIVADALFKGLAQSIADFKALLR
ncbi:MAG: pyridoxine 5'-phosphate synthase [Mariprofundaceae bacterium]|nr:pyridoxine 5'-phosphate synthase [Mariprofundaceae bacterium]